MIFSLILYTCLASGQECRPHVEVERLHMMECVLAGQQLAAKYATEHPKRVVRGIMCTDRPQRYIKAREA